MEHGRGERDAGDAQDEAGIGEGEQVADPRAGRAGLPGQVGRQRREDGEAGKREDGGDQIGGQHRVAPGEEQPDRTGHQNPGDRDHHAQERPDRLAIGAGELGRMAADLGEDQRVGGAVDRERADRHQGEDEGGGHQVDGREAQGADTRRDEDRAAVAGAPIGQEADQDAGEHIGDGGGEDDDGIGGVRHAELANGDHGLIGRGGGAGEAEEKNAGSGDTGDRISPEDREEGHHPRLAERGRAGELRSAKHGPEFAGRRAALARASGRAAAVRRTGRMMPFSGRSGLRRSPAGGTPGWAGTAACPARGGGWGGWRCPGSPRPRSAP